MLHAHHAHGAGKGDGVAGVHDPGALGGLARELVVVEGHVAELLQARAQPLRDGFAFQSVIAHGGVGRKKSVFGSL